MKIDPPRSEARASLGWARAAIGFGAAAYATVATSGVVLGLPGVRDRVQELVVAGLLVYAFVVWPRHTRRAAVVAVGVVGAEIGFSALAAGNPNSVGVLALPVLVACTGLLLGARAARWMSIGVATGYPALVLAHHALVAPTFDVSARTYFVLFSSAIVNLAMGVIGERALIAYDEMFVASERARQRFESLFEAAPDGLASIDERGRIVEANQMAARLLHVERSALIGQSLVAALQGAGGPAGIEISEARPGRPLTIQFSGSDGTARVLEIGVRARQDSDLGDLRLIAIRDVTEKRMIEERLGHAQRMETVGRLAGGVAHDFNNLLTVIGGNAGLLVEQGDPARPLAVEILDAQRRGVSLTRQLLSFARREVRKPESVDLGVAVGEVARLVERLLGEHHTLHVEVEPDVAVVADRSQLEQVIVNLATNARDAMAIGGPVHIRVRGLAKAEAAALGSTLAAPRQVMLEVEDAGVGISAVVRQRMFEPFFTTKPRGSGTGLGLATVHGIVTQSDGVVAVDSAPGFGARIRCFFPRNVAATPVAATPRWGPAPGEGENVLLVEDDVAVGQLAERLLIRSGYHVNRVTNADEALAVARLVRFDLLLTDVVMPGLSGPELAERLRAEQPHIPILFMSGYFEPTEGLTGRAGADLLTTERLITKPFSSKDLLRRVREVLDAEAQRA